MSGYCNFETIVENLKEIEGIKKVNRID